MAPETMRPPPDGPRPSAQGGRYRIPDLDAGSGRVTPPPTAAGARPTAPPVRTARARLYGPPEGLSAGRALGKTLGALGIVSDLYSSHLYMTGRIGHGEYWGGLGLSAMSMFAPYPVNAGIAAFQVGGAVGSFLAHRLIDAARKGDKGSIAFIKMLQRMGFINANDPTFVALAELGPPLNRLPGLILSQGISQWVPVSIWSQTNRRVSLDLSGGDLPVPVDLGEADLRLGANDVLIDQEPFATLGAGDYIVRLGSDTDAAETVLSLRVVDDGAEQAPRDALPFSASIAINQSRLLPTNLSWDRFDRPDPVLDGIPQDATTSGSWIWTETGIGPGSMAHAADPAGPAVHAVIFAEPRTATLGDHIIQYLWLAPDAPAQQVVLQVYDGDLSGAHRISLGDDILPFSDRSAFGHVSYGPMPPAGRWIRIKVPVSDIGMDGRQIAGLAFYAAGGQALFGPTKLSGAEDTAPRSVAIEDRDQTGAPEADVIAKIALPSEGSLEAGLALMSGGVVPLYAGTVSAGERHFWWQGEAALVTGARLVGTYRPADGEPIAIDTAMSGNPGLVAQIFYPPQGAVVRQTVPIFGQAGGVAFDYYVVEMRRYGAGDDTWQELATSHLPTVLTQSEVQTRIETILQNQLRSTIYGNLASMNTGSALHRFEFAESADVLESGWVELRLRSFDGDGNFAQAGTVVQIGEVATGQDATGLVSPDGNVVLDLPPFALNLGMGTLTVDVADQSLPPGVPTAAGKVYGFAPYGLALRASVQVQIEAEAGNSVVLLAVDGSAQALPTTRSGDVLTARIPKGARLNRFYATVDSPPPALTPFAVSGVPWFADVPSTHLEFAARSPSDSAIDLDVPLRINPDTVLVAGIRVADTDGLGLLLRFDGDVRVVPLGDQPLGSRDTMHAQPMHLTAGPDVQPVFMTLSHLLPPDARFLEGVELIKIASAAWRTYSAQVPPTNDAELVSIAIGRAPEMADAWDDANTNRVSADVDGWIDVIDAKGRTWPAVIDRNPPEISSASPVNGSEVSELIVRLTYTDIGGGVADNGVALIIDGVPVPTSLITFEGTPYSGEITVPLGNVPGLDIRSGAEITAQVSLADRFGQTSEPMIWQWTYAPAPLAFGNFRQITIDGGQTPIWAPDGATFIYAATNDGVANIARFDLQSEETTWLTDGPTGIANPAMAPDGAFAYTTATGAEIVDTDGSVRAVSGPFTGLVWVGDKWMATLDNRLVDLASPDTAICLGAPGATLLDPRPLDHRILVTQSIYHKTIWLCDPDSGSFTVLSADPNAPTTRERDATAIAANAYLFAKHDGLGGIWRRSIGNRADSLVVANDGGRDLAPMVAPDGNALLFQSGRTGQTEIWLLTFDQTVQVTLDQDQVQGLAATPITGTLRGGDAGVVWRLLDKDGQRIDFPISGTLNDGRFALVSDQDWPEGRGQLEVEMSGGIMARQEIVIDRTPPAVRVLRQRDQANLAEVETVSTFDRFKVQISDMTDWVLRDAGTGTLIDTTQEFAAQSAADPFIQIVAEDALGNRAMMSLDLRIGSSSERLTRIEEGALPVENGPSTTAKADVADDSPDTSDPSPDANGQMLAIVIALILISILAAGAIVINRRRAE